MSGPANKRRHLGYYGSDFGFGGMMIALLVFGAVIGFLLAPVWRYVIKPVLVWLLTLLTGGAA